MCQIKMFQSALILTPVTQKLSIQLYVKTCSNGYWAKFHHLPGNYSSCYLQLGVTHVEVHAE